MAHKLLAATALFVGPAVFASPPVDTSRVTGNVSTEHAGLRDVARPLTDPCRVTGNLMTLASKSPSAQPDGCAVRVADRRFTLTVFEVRGDGRCDVVGTREAEVCRVPTDTGHLDLPLAKPEV